jgi:hypothetical protein
MIKSQKIKSYCFNLDNTICHTYKDDYKNSVPIQERVSKINDLFKSGSRITIKATRSLSKIDDIKEFTREQLESWSLSYNELLIASVDVSDVIVNEKAINSEDFFEADYLSKESGGKTKVVLVNRVYKEATDERMDKLIDEINFIESIPVPFNQSFPKVSYYRRDDEKKKVYYEMPHYELPSLRRLIFSNKLDADGILYWSDKITKFSMELYNLERIETPETYLDDMHWDRFDKRMNELRRKDAWFEMVLNQETVQVNGKELINAPIIVEKLKAHQDLFQPEFVGKWSHSDLHFSNILIDEPNDDFVLIDPRGYDYCDYYYDFGKLWHSVNGKYEMVANRLWTMDGCNYKFHDTPIFDLLEEVKEGLPNLFFKYSNEDKDTVMMKVEFNEMMHFITLVPFQLAYDQVNSKAKVAYYVGLRLLNEFNERYLND